MHRQTEPTLLADIGATNARFSLLANGVLGPVVNFEVAGFARFADAVADFLKTNGDQAPRAALLAVAGPVEGNRARLTNCPWIIDGT